ncbi:hypothetical protein AMATHDRAFT_49980 [Amanita thiersii Skay4041]|uniref:Uncharacterized protein n=1 Tax=Amanita thiersii Skay4041 TaxID=703135 RepID=A0A2A9NJD4_9AGAR|nr:hypothetical protein AMATHDRAFT_49980 [Amanita thiersii Skay4041]
MWRWENTMALYTPKVPVSVGRFYERFPYFNLANPNDPKSGLTRLGPLETLDEAGVAGRPEKDLHTLALPIEGVVSPSHSIFDDLPSSDIPDEYEDLLSLHWEDVTRYDRPEYLDLVRNSIMPGEPFRTTFSFLDTMDKRTYRNCIRDLFSCGSRK